MQSVWYQLGMIQTDHFKTGKHIKNSGMGMTFKKTTMV